MLELVESGAVTGMRKEINPRKVVATTVTGTSRVYRFCDRNPGLELYQTTYTHNPYVIGTPEWVILLIVAAFGFSAIGYNGIYLVFVPEIAGKELAGVSTGFTLSISFLGIILGTPFFGYLVEFYGSYTFTWLSLALLMLLGMLLLRFVAEPKKDKKK